jgi:hypothetical protein
MQYMICLVGITIRRAAHQLALPLEGFLHSVALVCSAILHYTRRHVYLNIADIRNTELILKLKGEA